MSSAYACRILRALSALQRMHFSQAPLMAVGGAEPGTGKRATKWATIKTISLTPAPARMEFDANALRMTR
jgi:hypothetical protein